MPLTPAPAALQAQWRAMRPDDIAAIAALAACAHPALPERAAVLAEKQRLAPQSCFTLENRPSGAVIGYLLAHPWAAGDIPKINQFLRRLPQAADTVFLHDLALAPAARRQSYSQSGLKRLFAYARQAGFGAIALVSVNDTAGFWQKHGFTAAETLSGAAAAGLADYGDKAVFMIKTVTAA